MAEAGRSGARVADPTSAAILKQGEKMMASRLSETMPAFLEKLDESLFDLSEQTADVETKRLYIALQGELRGQRESIKRDFPEKLRAEFTKLDIPGLHAPGEGKSDLGFMSLSLVEFDDMEESLGVSGLAGTLRNACGTEFRDLAVRVGYMLGVSELREQDNPYDPELIARVFKQILAPISGVKSRILLLQLMGKCFPESLTAFYAELNKYLVSQGIDPEIKYRAKPSAAPAATSTAVSAPVLPPAAPSGENADPGDVFGALQQLIMMNKGGSGSSSSLVPVMPVQATDELLKSLTHLQRGNLEELPLTGDVVAGGFDPSQLEMGTSNLLRNIRDAGLYNPVSQVDAITIDVVALLFDFVFDDKDIPAAVRVLIGRLQIPVLKAAMLDKKFFSRKDNPARKLLDKLAQVSVAWSGEVKEDDPLYLRIAAVVHDVIDHFEEDASVFERAVEQLDQYIGEEESQASERSRNAAEALQKKEMAEFAQVVAQQEIMQRAQDAPPEILDYLMNYWIDVLVSAYKSEGEEGEGWKSGLSLVDDLVWSVKPKIQQEDRLRMVRSLPQLLKRIENAMKRKSAPEEDIKVFSTKLVDFHIAALKGATPAKEELDVSDVHVEAECNEAKETSELADQGEQVPASTEVIAVPVKPAIGVQKWTLPTRDFTEEDDYDRLAKQIKKGCWMEFTLDDGARLRVKLTWVSPMKGVMLFTQRDGSNAVKISPKSLASRFRAGTAVLLGDESLVERAVSNVMCQLKSASAPETRALAG